MGLELPPKPIKTPSKSDWTEKRCNSCGATELKGCNCAYCGNVRVVKFPENVYIKC